MTTQVVANKCYGGNYSCSPPKDCCKQGCCFFLPPTYNSRPTVYVQTGNVFADPLFLEHWYFWLAISATIAGIICACGLWRKHSQGGLCCRNNAGVNRSCSEPDSMATMYLPPQYSRCNSFQQSPPPYSEVTSKPDLYPLVINYNNIEPAIKTYNTSASSLMVQFFKNFKGKTAVSLTTTSTNDSISSSFLYNAVNDVNTVIPPTYSNVTSMEQLTNDGQQLTSIRINNIESIPRSASSYSAPNTEYQEVSQFCDDNNSITIEITPKVSLQQDNNQRDVCNDSAEEQALMISEIAPKPNKKQQQSKRLPVMMTITPKNQHQQEQQITTQASQDSTEDEPFAALLNLSLCVPNSLDHQNDLNETEPAIQDLRFGVTHSTTGSDISSLANLGTPDSPPRATSPTNEMRELLDKIQQLPIQMNPLPSPSPAAAAILSPTPSMATKTLTDVVPNNVCTSYKMKSKKTLYMPLSDNNGKKFWPQKSPNVFARNWLSQSAPSTPCTPLISPLIPSSRSSQKTQLYDMSPLLKQHVDEETD